MKTRIQNILSNHDLQRDYLGRVQTINRAIKKATLCLEAYASDDTMTMQYQCIDQIRNRLSDFRSLYANVAKSLSRGVDVHMQIRDDLDLAHSHPGNDSTYITILRVAQTQYEEGLESVFSCDEEQAKRFASSYPEMKYKILVDSFYASIKNKQRGNTR